MKPTFCFFESVDSTNTQIIEMPKELQTHGFCLSADFQTHGRGQSTNVWQSEANENLLFSLLLRPTNFNPSEQFLLSQIISLSIVQTLSHILECEVLIKWPNDIYVGNKKLAGILIEHSIIGETISRSIIGIGLNVNQTKFDPSIPNPISMSHILNHPVNRLDLLETLVQNILNDYEAWTPALSEQIHTLYMSSLYRKSGYHYFKLPNGTPFSAKIIDIGISGELILKRHNGEIESYHFKDVSFIINPSES